MKVVKVFHLLRRRPYSVCNVGSVQCFVMATSPLRARRDSIAAVPVGGVQRLRARPFSIGLSIQLYVMSRLASGFQK